MWRRLFSIVEACCQKSDFGYIVDFLMIRVVLSMEHMELSDNFQKIS